MSEWCVWYAGGDSYSNEDGEAAYAPGGGVVAITQFTDDKAVIVSGSQGYFWYDNRDDRWYVSDLAGLWQQVLKGGYLVLKLGVWVTTPEFNEIHNNARHWKPPRLRKP